MLKVEIAPAVIAPVAHSYACGREAKACSLALRYSAAPTSARLLPLRILYTGAMPTTKGMAGWVSCLAHE